MNHEEFLGTWQRMSEKQRRELLPHLLLKMEGWRRHSSEACAEIEWLRQAFEDAKAPFTARMCPRYQLFQVRDVEGSFVERAPATQPTLINKPPNGMGAFPWVVATAGLGTIVATYWPEIVAFFK